MTMAENLGKALNKKFSPEMLELEGRIEKVVDRLIECDRAETARLVVKLKALWAERRRLLGG